MRNEKAEDVPVLEVISECHGLVYIQNWAAISLCRGLERRGDCPVKLSEILYKRHLLL